MVLVLLLFGGQSSSTIYVSSLGDAEVVLRDCNRVEKKTENTVITINGYTVDGNGTICVIGVMKQ